MATIALETRPCDPQVTLAQVGWQTLADLGARDYVHDAPNGMVRFTYGNTRGDVRKVIITLTSADLYHVEAGRMPRRGPQAWEWISGRELDLVDAESLPTAVREVTR